MMNCLTSCILVLVAVGAASAGWFSKSPQITYKFYDVAITLGDFQEGPYGGLYVSIKADLKDGMPGKEINLAHTTDKNIFKPNQVFTVNQGLAINSLDDIKEATVRFFRIVSGSKVFGPATPISVQKITFTGEGESLCFKPPTGGETLPPVANSGVDKIDLVRC